MFKILIKVLEYSVEKNGADTKLTLGHLLNICKLVVNMRSDEIATGVKVQHDLDQEFFEETNRYGSGS